MTAIRSVLQQLCFSLNRPSKQKLTLNGRGSCRVLQRNMEKLHFIHCYKNRSLLYTRLRTLPSPRSTPVKDITEATMEPTFVSCVVATAVDVLIQHVRVVPTESLDFLF